MVHNRWTERQTEKVISGLELRKNAVLWKKLSKQFLILMYNNIV